MVDLGQSILTREAATQMLDKAKDFNGSWTLGEERIVATTNIRRGRQQVRSFTKSHHYRFGLDLVRMYLFVLFSSLFFFSFIGPGFFFNLLKFFSTAVPAFCPFQADDSACPDCSVPHFVRPDLGTPLLASWRGLERRRRSASATPLAPGLI
jgi:hypothetical protein